MSLQSSTRQPSKHLHAPKERTVRVASKSLFELRLSESIALFHVHDNELHPCQARIKIDQVLRDGLDGLDRLNCVEWLLHGWAVGMVSGRYIRSPVLSSIHLRTGRSLRRTSELLDKTSRAILPDRRLFSGFWRHFDVDQYIHHAITTPVISGRW